MMAVPYVKTPSSVKYGFLGGRQKAFLLRPGSSPTLLAVFLLFQMLASSSVPPALAKSRVLIPFPDVYSQ